jgi:hypothetical protein
MMSPSRYIMRPHDANRHRQRARPSHVRASVAIYVCRLPPPRFHSATWQVLCQLTRLRSLSLANSTGITSRHIEQLTVLTDLEALDLTGVKLPVSTLNTFAVMSGLTQLRIPKVTVVQERFLQMHGDAPTCPLLADMLEAMPQLRHLDLYWAGKGDGQSIVKDMKHMQTLAAATQLRCLLVPMHAAVFVSGHICAHGLVMLGLLHAWCGFTMTMRRMHMRRRLDIAKLCQITDSALSKISTLTALTALKLGCNTWDLYCLSGQCELPIVIPRSHLLL